MARAATILLCLALTLAAPAGAETRLRVASYDTELRRDGPGLLLRDILRGEDAQIAAVVAVIAAARADVIALQGIDWDLEGRTLSALAARLEQAGAPYPHRFAARPNAGLATELDLDGDGRRGGPGDAQGYGAFSGQGGIAVLSRFPIRTGAVQDFSALAWRDLPGALLPTHPDGSPFPSEQAQAIQRLSSTGHWAVPIDLPGGETLTLLTFRAGPPVFDGPEDRNGRRNHDEIAFWRHYLDGRLGPAPRRRFVIAGGANLDPDEGEGRRSAIRALLADPRLGDPAPTSPGAEELGDPTDTVDWSDVGAGRIRVDYVLPSADWRVTGAGVLWPARGAPLHAAVTRASRHRLVWADLALPQPD